MLYEFELDLKLADLGGLIPDTTRWQGEIRYRGRSVKVDVFEQETTWRASPPSAGQVFKEIAFTVGWALGAETYEEWRKTAATVSPWPLTEQAYDEFIQQPDRLGRLVGDLDDVLAWIEAADSQMTWEWPGAVVLIER